ncbi:aminoglycoside phosphotransferase family protein [Kineosporia babensis]|uniref:Aminoglycoside phosphotransferase family protein n=1 Tax=Kineosporia babensis TaxID=499548 RepID=A0A9X1NKQ4_9ACTN|nr:aminoglycoside phosphotransferase family protein [Kineosporia babensis]MCD5315875.1 aminoglycoside phosphotransferase family protein [Kineosporia babensis]
MTRGFEQLSERQQVLLGERWAGAEVVQDHSWGQVDTTVLEVLHAGERLVVKAAARAAGHHLLREIHAHRHWVGVWRDRGRAPELLWADADARVLVTRYLPGHLVQGTDSEFQPETHRQAGELLAAFHAQFSVPERDFEVRAQAKTLWWLDQPHRIDPTVVQRLREVVASWPTPSVACVPTHGDWQPRNWLVHDGEVRVIDFGRAELRPAFTDVTRLMVQQWRGRPDLEAAFYEGYGAPPADPDVLQRDLVRGAISTAVWAYRVGDEGFEAQGLRMIADVLAVEERMS